jgi:hypothetical protein
MKFTPLTELKAFMLTEVPALDPITVILHDIAPGQGKITVECYGQAWSSYWGAMGTRSVAQFVASCDVTYLVGKMNPITVGRSTGKSAEAYLARILTVVKEALGTVTP